MCICNIIFQIFNFQVTNSYRLPRALFNIKFGVGRKIIIYRKYKNYIKVKQSIEEFETVEKYKVCSGLNVLKKNSMNHISSGD